MVESLAKDIYVEEALNVLMICRLSNFEKASPSKIKKENIAKS
jgi:hypothetical protein